LFEKKKAEILIIIVRITIGNIIRDSDIPADLRASNSKFSPRLPNVINEASKMARGSDNGTKDAAAYNMSSLNVDRDNPLPIRSSIYFHRNCMIRIKRVIKKVRMSGPMYDFNIKRCSFFTKFI